MLSVINEVFGLHYSHVNKSKMPLEFATFEATLYDIFFASNKLGEHSIDIEACSNLTLQFLKQVFIL